MYLSSPNCHKWMRVLEMLNAQPHPLCLPGKPSLQFQSNATIGGFSWSKEGMKNHNPGNMCLVGFCSEAP